MKDSEAHEILYTAINQKLDRLILTTDRVAESVQEHATILARQDVTLSRQEAVLAEHMRRTALLEEEVEKLDQFRNRVIAVSTFSLSLVAILASVFKFVF